jgi:hypothetical protein
MAGCSLSFPSFLPSGTGSLYEFPNTDIRFRPIWINARKQPLGSQ